jgi:NADH-quinone oxidoreductase subunit F
MISRKLIVGMGSCGLAAGAGKIWDKLNALKQTGYIDYELSSTGCIGMCYMEPLLEVADEKGSVTYGKVDVDRLSEIIEKHLLRGEIVRRYIVRSGFLDTPEDSFFSSQKRIVLRNCGLIDPENIDEYILQGGYEALRHIAREKILPDQVIDEVIASGIRGRGGGGFPTGKKWQLTRGAGKAVKHIICNADEGDPGAFMDRSVLESDPHSVIEGMIIAAYAIGASDGVIYCRAEYPLAVKRLKKAIAQAKEYGFLGKDITGLPGFCFTIIIKEGAGAFVCGEETALIASVEGRRGMPKRKPPYPAESGLWEEPTSINNVETLSNIPWIILNGSEAFSSIGTSGSKGTKVFALTGKIRRGGLAEVPMGITINDIIFGPGGGIRDGHKFKAVQLGGPSGGCVPASMGDTSIDYESLASTGAIMGSGGMVVMDETTCMVDVARFFLDFTCHESCGKCTFCRLGTKRMLEILERICNGKGKEGDIETLEELSHEIINSSLCGLGQTAPNPVLTTIKYFRDEYEAHIREKRCPTSVCLNLLTYSILPDKCTGCTICARECPVSAISGEKKKVHCIDDDLCTRCGACFNKCPFNAIERK